MQNRLYRSSTDVMIAGVCSGLARYLGIDPTLVRLFFVLLGLAGGGIGFLIYLLLWIVVPVEGAQRDVTLEETVRTGSQEIADRAREMGDDLRNIVNRPNPQAARVIGAGLILMGIVFLLENLHLPWLNWLDFDVIWPALLILAGIALLFRHMRKE